MKAEIIEKINEHYEHAKEKHPYFCDKLNFYTKKGADCDLSHYREFLEISIDSEGVAVNDVLACEADANLNNDSVLISLPTASRRHRSANAKSERWRRRYAAKLAR